MSTKCVICVANVAYCSLVVCRNVLAVVSFPSNVATANVAVVASMVTQMSRVVVGLVRVFLVAVWMPPMRISVHPICMINVSFQGTPRQLSPHSYKSQKVDTARAGKSRKLVPAVSIRIVLCCVWVVGAHVCGFWYVKHHHISPSVARVRNPDVVSCVAVMRMSVVCTGRYGMPVRIRVSTVVGVISVMSTAANTYPQYPVCQQTSFCAAVTVSAASPVPVVYAIQCFPAAVWASFFGWVFLGWLAVMSVIAAKMGVSQTISYQNPAASPLKPQRVSLSLLVLWWGFVKEFSVISMGTQRMINVPPSMRRGA